RCAPLPFPTRRASDLETRQIVDVVDVEVRVEERRPEAVRRGAREGRGEDVRAAPRDALEHVERFARRDQVVAAVVRRAEDEVGRSEEHTSELQSRENL